MPCYCRSLAHASARQLRRDHASPPPLPRCTDGSRSRRDGHVRLRRLLAVQVRAQHPLREQPQLPPHLHCLHRVLRRHVQQLHGRRRRRRCRRGRPGRRGSPRGRVRPLPVPRRPEPRRLRGVREGDGGAARRGVRQLLRRVAAGGRLLRAVRRQRLRRPCRQHRRVPEVQLQHQRGRRVPQEPRRRAQAAAGAGGHRVQADHIWHRAGGGAVPRRHRGARVRRLSGGGGGAAQGDVRLGAGRRRVFGAVLCQVLGKWPRFPIFPRLFRGRIWEDGGNNSRYLGWASTHRRVHLFPHESMSWGQGDYLGLGPCVMVSTILIKEVMKLPLQPACLLVKNYCYTTAGLDTSLLPLYLAFILLYLAGAIRNPLYVMLVSWLNIQGVPILVGH